MLVTGPGIKPQCSRSSSQVGRLENVVGWYHSHPGYGCWLSGIDVGTQLQNQQYQEPWLAVVIDPTRTVSAGKVEIGAFRTFPEGYKPPDEAPSEYQTIPLNKIEDFGVHSKRVSHSLCAIFQEPWDDISVKDVLPVCRCLQKCMFEWEGAILSSTIPFQPLGL